MKVIVPFKLTRVDENLIFLSNALENAVRQSRFFLSKYNLKKHFVSKYQRFGASPFVKIQENRCLQS